MEIVNRDQAPTLERTDAVQLLQEMASVIRTIFGARVEAPASPAPAPPVVPAARAESVAPAPVTVAAAAVPAPPAGLPVPGLAPTPTIPVPAIGLDDTAEAVSSKAAALSLPVPALGEPIELQPIPAETADGSTAENHDDDPHERHSLALLQEIAFLDD